jgi:hypothetical protein
MMPTYTIDLPEGLILLGYLAWIKDRYIDEETLLIEAKNLVRDILKEPPPEYSRAVYHGRPHA